MYVAERSAFATRGVNERLREMILGDGVRDWHSWGVSPWLSSPYDNDFQPIRVEDERSLLSMDVVISHEPEQ